jgi:hypothetical protein
MLLRWRGLLGIADRAPGPTAVACAVPQCRDLAAGTLAALDCMTAAAVIVTESHVFRCLLGTICNPFAGSTRIF